MTARVPAKKQTLLAFLQRGVAMVHLDARRPGVQVPEQFREEAHLRLNLSYRYNIPDLDISEERVQATLSFGGRHFQCVMPWDAIFGITSHASGDGQVWPEDLPVEVVQTMAERDGERPADDGRMPTPRDNTPLRNKPVLAAVTPTAAEPAPAEPEAKAPETAPKRHLRLVR